MAGGGSSRESPLGVAKLNGATAGYGPEDIEKSPMHLELSSRCSVDAETETSDEDDEIALPCHDVAERTAELQLIPNSGTAPIPHKSSASSLGIMLSHPSPVLSRNPKRVSKFYQKQSDLVENFKKDSTVIEEYRKRRQKRSGAPEEVEDGAESEMLPALREPRAGLVPPESGTMNGEVRPPSVRVRRHSTHAVRGLVPCNNADKAARWLAMATLIANVSLVIAKAAAAVLSGSLSIISSLVDSAVDITSGLVIWLTARAIRKRDPYMYPRGRTRLEPIALIIVSVIMGVASVQMIVQSLESIVHGTIHPRVDFISLSIMVATIFIKFTLMLLCKKFSYDPSVAVLAQDHRNDCISNTVAIACAWGASNYWLYLDPLGAIIVSIYIATTWFFTGKEHLTMLSGRSAEPEFINRIVKVCVEHDKRINYIDTVYVYHFGTRFLVEVHIVMDPKMTLRESHDISEALQTNIESLTEVERAFVHCDYEYDHLPADEHKVV